MNLKLDELEYLKDGGIIRRKIDEVNQFFKEKGYAIKLDNMPMDCDKDELTFHLYISIPRQNQ
jgi:hypothetical protein